MGGNEQGAADKKIITPKGSLHDVFWHGVNKGWMKENAASSQDAHSDNHKEEKQTNVSSSYIGLGSTENPELILLDIQCLDINSSDAQMREFSGRLYQLIKEGRINHYARRYTLIEKTPDRFLKGGSSAETRPSKYAFYTSLDNGKEHDFVFRYISRAELTRTGMMRLAPDEILNNGEEYFFTATPAIALEKVEATSPASNMDKGNLECMVQNTPSLSLLLPIKALSQEEVDLAKEYSITFYKNRTGRPCVYVPLKILLDMRIISDCSSLEKKAVEFDSDKYYPINSSFIPSSSQADSASQ